MDQESFRKLLESDRSSTLSKRTPTSSRGSLIPPTKSKTENASEPAFKPRKVKKQGQSRYRDRATERREGLGNDYAQAEALLEDFERRNAEIEDRDAVEEQRRYLGGDSEHSILVKGLDFSLLEQNKARVAAATSADDDESLEKAFVEATTSSVPTKRTREDILRELKGKREKEDVNENDSVKGEVEGAPLKLKSGVKEKDMALEEAKQMGKFKPIGFKPIGGALESKSKKKKVKENRREHEGERKKKKRKVGVADGSESRSMEAEPTGKEQATNEISEGQKGESDFVPLAQDKVPLPEPEPEPIEDFDIFAEAGEYQGIDLGDDDEEDEVEQEESRPVDPPAEEEQPPSRANWFRSEEPDEPPLAQGTPPPDKSKSRSPRSQPEEEEEPQEMRLAPLASSAIPSIRELLALDEAAEKNQKRKAKKEKKKGKKSKNDEDSE